MPDKLKVIITAAEISARVGELAARISSDYGCREIVALGVLKGAWLFMADLVRRLSTPVRCDFVGISSYGSGRETSGVVRITSDVSLDIADRHVLIVEDIIDTGLTTRYLLDTLATRQPASLRVCCLLDKKDRRRIPVPLDYVGFSIPDAFVVGYGLDYRQQYRNLPYIAELATGE